MNNQEHILTILVLHNMELRNSCAFQSLTRNLKLNNNKGHLFVYDNTHERQVISGHDCWEIAYFHDPSNSGVSRAYNMGALMAQKLGKRWLLLADQDTTFPDDIFEKYILAMDLHPGYRVFAPILTDNQGVISPFKPGYTSGNRIKKVVVGRHLLDQMHAINSGLLIDLQLFETAGGYDERFKLDFSDIVFFSKLKFFIREIVIVGAFCGHGHSSQESGNIEFGLSRFKGYLHALSILGSTRKARAAYLIRAGMRAVKLSFQYKSVRFVGSLFGTT